MDKREYEKKVEVVREYILSQSSDTVHGEESLRQMASENNVTVKSLRNFADGNDSALAKPVVTLWSKLIHGSDVLAGEVVNDLTAMSGAAVGPGDDLRNARFDQYDLIEETRPEADRALAVWADTVVHGSSGDSDRYGVAFEAQPITPNESFRKVLNGISAHLNTNVLPPDEKHMLVRDVVKNGGDFEQLGLGVGVDGRVHVTELFSMPVRQMRVLKGDPTYRYGLFLPGQTVPDEQFEDWKISYFANKQSRSDDYGRSQFRSCLRTWVQVEALEVSIMTRRLTRSGQSKKWTVDTSKATTEKERLNILKQHRDFRKKQKAVDMSGNLQKQRIAMPEDEDYIVGKTGKDAVGDVENLEGDSMIGEITDFNHFFNKFLTGLGPPKAYLGYEADTQRSVATELAINFARMARRLQMRIIQGLNHLFWVELILRGIDPRSARYMIYAPPLGTRDEQIRAQIQQTHALTVMQLSQAFNKTGKQPSIEWFLRYVMNYDDEAIASMDYMNIKGGKPDAAKKDDPTPGQTDGVIKQIAASRRLTAEISLTKFLIDESILAKMKPEELETAWNRTGATQLPKMNVEQCARDLWIPELHKA